ncbi:MAG: DUF488 domain-containing protein [Desulfobacterales bacterium]|nr:DUF488 domain-containing protein [Desulfobacterales bacterium]
MNDQANKINELYTIGYSGFTLNEFINVLKKHGINAIADVRSVPYSKFKPEYNRDNLKAKLKNSSIEYVFLGDLCGARIEAQECYKNGKADYALIAKHPKFQEGIKRIKKGLEKYRIALLCAEKDPVSCHRMILICRHLSADDIKIFHIIDFRSVLTQSECEARLLKLFKLDQPDLFRDVNDQITEAYEKQAEKIAYVAESAAEYTAEDEGSSNE